MHFLTATLGLAMLVLIGVVSVLALMILVLYEARWIAHLATRITTQDEPAPLRFPDDLDVDNSHSR